ncbi:MAG: TRAP transporter large permease subunit [Paracoccaceae bacterium]
MPLSLGRHAFRGGLATASLRYCAAFAAVSGSSVATAVTIGRVALLEMKRFGYSDRLATGAIAAGGTLTRSHPRPVSCSTRSLQRRASASCSWRGSCRACF